MRVTIPRARPRCRGPAPATSNAPGRPAAGTGPAVELRFARAVQAAGPRCLGLARPRRCRPCFHGLAAPAAHAARGNVQGERDRFVRPALALRALIALQQGPGPFPLPPRRALAPAAALSDPGQPLPFRGCVLQGEGAPSSGWLGHGIRRKRCARLWRKCMTAIGCTATSNTPILC